MKFYYFFFRIIEGINVVYVRNGLKAITREVHTCNININRRQTAFALDINGVIYNKEWGAKCQKRKKEKRDQSVT